MKLINVRLKIRSGNIFESSVFFFLSSLGSKENICKTFMYFIFENDNVNEFALEDHHIS